MRSQTTVVPFGSKKKIVSLIVPITSCYYSVHLSPSHLDSWKNLAFLDLLSRNNSLKDLNSHQLAHSEIPKEISFFNKCEHEVQYLIDHNSCADDGNDSFCCIVLKHPGETKALYLRNDGTDLICTDFDSKSPKALFNISDSLQQGKSNDNRRKCQGPPMVLQVEIHENIYSDDETNSEESDNEITDQDLVSD